MSPLGLGPPLSYIVRSRLVWRYNNLMDEIMYVNKTVSLQAHYSIEALREKAKAWRREEENYCIDLS